MSRDGDGIVPLEVDPVQAAAWIEGGARVFDVREAAERQLGTIRGAADLESMVESAAIPDASTGGPLLLYCATGSRSLEEARRLRAAGFEAACSIRGGFHSWRALGLPCDYPTELDASQAVRYARQIVLPQVGASGQARLARSRVMLIGAGGLGSPAALYLAGAGVGTLGIVDGDLVERGNLHRQVLHEDAGVGRRKTDSARERLTALNPDIEVLTFDGRIGPENARQWLTGWDLVVDGSDNLPTRYCVNQACVELGLPLVYGAVSAFEGQLSLLHPESDPGGLPCYQCLFPPSSAPPPPDCNTVGVLGVMPGLIGLMQATEALKWLLGVGHPLLGELLLVDGLATEFRRLRVRARDDCEVCGRSPAR